MLAVTPHGARLQYGFFIEGFAQSRKAGNIALVFAVGEQYTLRQISFHTSHPLSFEFYSLFMYMRLRCKIETGFACIVISDKRGFYSPCNIYLHKNICPFCTNRLRTLAFSLKIRYTLNIYMYFLCTNRARFRKGRYSFGLRQRNGANTEK